MADQAGLDELDRWLRYEFLPRQTDGALWRSKPPAEAAKHYLEELTERIARMSEYGEEEF